MEIAQRTRAERTIRALEKTLKRQKTLLARKSVALGELVKQIEWAKRQVMNNVIANAEELLLPLLNKMQLAGASRKYITLMRHTIRKIASGFGMAISKAKRQMTAREIEISNMIRSGLSCKEISELLHISHRSAEWHSHNIRKKLGIIGKKVGLKDVLKKL